MIEMFKILSRFTGGVKLTVEIDCNPNDSYGVKLGLAVKNSIKSADLRGADLSSADLSSANLRGADLSSADLSSANLSSANLRGANLSSANLSSANLYGADLYGANLRGANLSSADLYGANLSSANLSSANLYGANLSSANLSSAKNAELIIAQTRILPEGSLIGWKKCQNGVIVKLRIPEIAKRSHAFGRKCRAEFAEVLDVINSDVGISKHDGKTEYRKGCIVKPDNFSNDWQDECSEGIHFFITKEEAENY